MSSPRPKSRAPGPSTRKDAKDASREALLRAGLELFAAQGLDSPSLDAICKRAGYTRGAFYVHFADREVFLEAVLVRVLEGYTASIVSTGNPTDLQATIHRFSSLLTSTDDAVDPLTPGGAASHLRILLEGCRRSPAVRARFEAGVELSARALAELIRNGQTAGTVRSDLDPDAAAGLLVTLVLGFLAVRETGVPFDGAGGLQVVMSILSG